MKVKCVWEHNGDDSILYASNFIGAFTRGKSKCEAIGKMSSEISAYLKWKGALTWDVPEPEIIQEKVSTLTILMQTQMCFLTRRKAIKHGGI